MFNSNKNFFNVKSVANLIAGVKTNFNINKVNKTDLISDLLATKTDKI